MTDKRPGELRQTTIQEAPLFVPQARPASVPKMFVPAWASFERACQHNKEFERLHIEFMKQKAIDVFLEPDAATGLISFFVRPTKPVPELLGNIAADVAINLRAAPDQAAFACAVAGGSPHPRNAQFPFGGTAGDVQAMRKSKSSEIPPEIFEVMAAARPHRDGDVCFWAINRLSNSHKHRVTILPGANAIASAERVLQTIGFRLDGLTFPRWDFENGQMLIARLPPGKGPQFSWQSYICFSEPEELREGCCGKQLDYMCGRVGAILTNLGEVAIRSGLVA